MIDVSEYLPSVLGSAALMFGCWFLGRFDHSIAWLVIFVLVNAVKSKLWKDRQRRVIALQQAAMREKDVVLAQLKDLPAWVQFPDTERVEWMNKVIYQLWPYIGEYSTKFIKEIVEPQVKAHMPRMLKSFRFQEIDIGDIPLRVSGIKVYTENVGRDRIIMDMDVAYAGDCEFVVAVGAFRGGLRQMQFKGKLRAVLSPLIPRPPMVGGVSVFFLDLPTVDFDLTGLGEFVELPLLITTVRNVVNEQISSICVLPNQIVVPLTTDTNVVEMYFQEPDVPFSVGAQTFQTKTIDNSLEPVWNEIFDAVVDQASGQKLNVEIFDDDIGKNDDFLGRLSIDIDGVREKGLIDSWHTLESVKHGRLHLLLHWLNLSKNPQLMDDRQNLHAGGKSHALLLLYVDCVSNLPSSKLNFEPSPRLVMTLGNETQKTFPRPKTRNPLFRQKFIFFVSNFEQQKLKFEAKDDANNNLPLGEYEVDLRKIVNEPNLEIFQQTVDLALGPHNSQMVISVRLRFLEPTKQKLDVYPASSAPSHISFAHLDGDDTKLSWSNKNSPNENRPSSSQSSLYADSENLQHLQQQGGPGGTLRLRKLKRRALSEQYAGDLGTVDLEMQYRTEAQKLSVLIKNAKNLKPGTKDGSVCPYVSAKLLLHGKVVLKKKTSTFKNTPNPVFAENLEFVLGPVDYPIATLVLDVKDASQSSWIRETPVIGQVLLDMAKLKIAEPFSCCFTLITPCYFRDQNLTT